MSGGTVVQPKFNTQTKPSISGAGLSSGDTVVFDFNEDRTLQGANAALYTVNENNITGIRLAKASGLESLVAYWDGRTLTTTYLDTAGVGGTYALKNVGVTSVSTHAGPYGSGAGEEYWQFTRASGHHIDFEFPLIEGSAFTLDMQLYLDSDGILNYVAHVPANYQYANANFGWASNVQLSAPQPTFVTEDKWQSDIATDNATSWDTWSTATWTHQRIVFDGAATTVSLYTDGTRQHQDVAWGHTDVQNFGDITFGNLPAPAASNTFDGAMADIRLFNTALTSAASFTAPTDYLTEVYDTSALNGKEVWTDQIVKTGGTVSLDMSTVAFHWDGETSDDNLTEIEIVGYASSSPTVAITDATDGNFFDEGSAAHSDPIGAAFVCFYRQNSGAFVVPPRLSAITVDVL